MKKKIVTVKDFTTMQAKIQAAKKSIKNELTEDAAELRRSLLDMLDELENAEVEVDESALADKVRELIEAYNSDEKSEVPAAVANAIAAKVKALQNTMPVSDKLTPAIKNQVAAAILRATGGKDDVKNAVEAVMVRNGITGLEFDDVVDFAIADNWGESNRLFNALHKTPITKFFYTAQDVTDSGVTAHGWAKTSETEKIVQAITALKKHIDRQFIYKVQEVANEDMAEIRKSGTEATFLRWLNEELDRQIVNTIVSVMLGTYQGSDITTIEALMGTGVSDAFRTAVAMNGDSIAITDIRALSDAVPNPYGKAKWLVISQADLTAISAFVFAEGGSTTYHAIDTLKGMLGVDEIYVTSLTTTPIVFLPDGYWFSELTNEAISVSYPNWKNNIMAFQKERYAGAAVHDLKSVAFIEAD